MSLWGGREPRPGERWDYFGYGPRVRHSRPAHLTEAEFQARLRRGWWIAAGEAVFLVAAMVVVGVVTRSIVWGYMAVFAAAFALLLLVVLATGARAAYKRLRRLVPAEPAGGGGAGQPGPDQHGDPIVQRRRLAGLERDPQAARERGDRQ